MSGRNKIWFESPTKVNKILLLRLKRKRHTCREEGCLASAETLFLTFGYPMQVTFGSGRATPQISWKSLVKFVKLVISG